MTSNFSKEMFSETEKIMLEFFVEREGEGIVNVIRSLDFIDEGILDSMDFIVLACFVEEKFGKKLEKPMSFSPSSFRIRRAKFLIAAAVILFLALLIGVSLYG